MSAEDSRSSQSLSPSPFSGSDSESDEMTGAAAPYIKLKDIKTLSALYRTGIIKAAEKTLYKSSSSLLDRVSLFQGDITRLDIDAIVNAANRSLLGGGGVDGAIHAAAGRKLLEECRSLNGCLTGQSKITRGYKLPARYVIHTVGPIYSVREKNEKAAELASSYKTSLELAVKNAIRHVAFPSISTGIYSYPIIDATRIALNTVRIFLESEDASKLENVVFVVWSDKDRTVYEKLIPEYFPPVEELSDQPDKAVTVAEEEIPSSVDSKD